MYRNPLRFTQSPNWSSLPVYNAGNLWLDKQKSPVVGMLISGPIPGTEPTRDIRRPEFLLASPSNELMPLMEDLWDDGKIGIVKFQLDNGSCLAALAFENQTKALWCLFDTNGPAGRSMLLDWQKHQNISMTCMSSKNLCSGQHPIKTGLIGELLSRPQSQRERVPYAEQLWAIQGLSQQLKGDSKQRLFMTLASETTIDSRDFIPMN
jgi:hypothetical protein